MRDDWIIVERRLNNRWETIKWSLRDDWIIIERRLNNRPRSLIACYWHWQRNCMYIFGFKKNRNENEIFLISYVVLKDRWNPWLIWITTADKLLIVCLIRSFWISHNVLNLRLITNSDTMLYIDWAIIRLNKPSNCNYSQFRFFLISFMSEIL